MARLQGARRRPKALWLCRSALTGALLFLSLVEDVAATPIVIIRTKAGYVVGTNAVAIVSDAEHPSQSEAKNVCKVILLKNLALISAGQRSAMHLEGATKVKDIDFERDYEDALTVGGTIDEMADRIVQTMERDTRKDLARYPLTLSTGLIPVTGANFLLLQVQHRKVSILAITVKARVVNRSADGFEFERLDHTAEAADSHKISSLLGPILEQSDVSIPLEKRTPRDGKALVERQLDQISRRYKQGSDVSAFDRPFVILNVGPKGIALEDPSRVCERNVTH